MDLSYSINVGHYRITFFWEFVEISIDVKEKILLKILIKFYVRAHIFGDFYWCKGKKVFFENRKFYQVLHWSLHFGDTLDHQGHFRPKT